MTEERYSHLLPAVADLADADDAIRIRRIRSDRWVSYSRADSALSALEELRTCPKRTRMPNLLLVGPTNNGKTMIIEKFRRMCTRDSVDPSDSMKVPIVKVQMPHTPDERRFFAAILGALGVPDRTNERAAAKQTVTIRLMVGMGVQMLLLDEIHNVLCGSRGHQRRMLSLLRWLGNELQISLVAVGTAEALRAIHSDDQLANRFMPFALPPWRPGAELNSLLNTLEAILPLKEPSRLSDSKLAQKLLATSEGILGEVVALVTRAAVAAIEAGEERITAERLDRLEFVAPSKRHRLSYA